MNRQKMALLALLLLFAASLAYAWHRMPRQQKAAPHPVAAVDGAVTAVPQKRPAIPGETTKAQQGLMLPEPEQATVKIKRDLFTPFHVLEARIAAKKAAAVKPPPPPPPPPPPTPAEIARQQARQYKSLGLLKQHGSLVAFLAKDRQIFIVRTGETLISGYQVTGITDSQVMMQAEDGDTISIGLK